MDAADAMNAPTHCACLSGITEGQAKLLELRGALQVVEWLTFEALSAHSGPGPLGSPEVVAYLERLQVGLIRAGDFCRTHGWRRSQEGNKP